MTVTTEAVATTDEVTEAQHMAEIADLDLELLKVLIGVRGMMIALQYPEGEPLSTLTLDSVTGLSAPGSGKLDRLLVDLYDADQINLATAVHLHRLGAGMEQGTDRNYLSGVIGVCYYAAGEYEMARAAVEISAIDGDEGFMPIITVMRKGLPWRELLAPDEQLTSWRTRHPRVLPL